MGTNYVVMEEVRCENCGHKQLTGNEERHIGKSSGGWCFSLRVYTEEEDGINLTSWAEWEEYLKDRIIKDEYSQIIPFDTFKRTVTERSWNVRSSTARYMGYKDEQDMLDKNNAEWGPNGLLRHQVGGICIAHGEGTWDLMKGEFC